MKASGASCIKFNVQRNFYSRQTFTSVKKKKKTRKKNNSCRKNSRKCKIQTQKQTKKRKANETVRGYKFRSIERRSYQSYRQWCLVLIPWAQFCAPHFNANVNFMLHFFRIAEIRQSRALEENLLKNGHPLEYEFTSRKTPLRKRAK